MSNADPSIERIAGKIRDQARLPVAEESLLEFLIAFIEENGYQPNEFQIASSLGHIGRTSVGKIMNRLRQKGYLAPADTRINRAIRILRTPDGQTFRGFTRKVSAR